MADNLTTTTTVSTVPNGSVIATDDVGGVHFQKVKIDVGGDGASAVLGDANPLPVSDAGSTLSVDDGAGSLTVDNGGTFVTQENGAALTALQLLDDTVATDGSATPTKGILIAGQDGTNAQTVKTDSDGNLQIDVLTIAAGDNNIGNVDIASLPAIPAGTNNIGDVDVLTLPAIPAGNNNIGDVDIASITAGDNVIGRVKLSDGTDVADILDLTNSNPLAVAIVDTNGDQLSSIGGGTQYTEDAAAAANPVGNALMMVREDARAGNLTTTDGDNVAARGNNKGELYVKTTDSDALLTTIDADTGNISTKIDTLAGTVKAEDVAAQAADTGIPLLAVRRDADTSLVGTDNDYANLQVDANGYLKVEVFDGGGSHTVDDGGSTLSVDDGAGSLTVDNGGTFVTQENGAALTALQLLDDTVVQDDAAFTPGTTKVIMSGFQADEASTDSVDEGDGGAARMTLDRKVIVNPQPHTAGGLLIFRSLDLDETEEEVKASAGQIYGWYIANLATSTRFIKIYNATAANVTVGTTTPVITIPIPGNSSDDVAANALGGMGIAFDTAITVAATTGLADNDTGAPGASEVVVNIFYK